MWVYDRDNAPIQENIKNVGSGYRFYGANNDELENALANAESKYGQVYKQILSSPGEISKHGNDLADLIWLFGFRTRAMRERMRHSLVAAGNAFQQKRLTVEFREFLEAKLLEKLENRIFAEHGPLTGFQKIELRQSHQFRRAMDESRRIIRTAVRSGTLDQLFNETVGIFGHLAEVPHLLDDEHNVGIGEFLTSGGRYPEHLKPKCWRAVISDKARFVLGDCGAFALKPDGSVEPALGVGKTALEICLPISPRMAAVGAFDQTGPRLDEGTIIEGAISTSYESFFASRYSVELQALAKKLLGSRQGLVTKRELDGIFDNLFRK